MIQALGLGDVSEVVEHEHCGWCRFAFEKRGNPRPKHLPAAAPPSGQRGTWRHRCDDDSPPLQYSDVKDVLLGTQVAKVDDDIKYNELLSTLTAALNFKPKSQTKWDTKRRAYLKAIAPIL